MHLDALSEPPPSHTIPRRARRYHLILRFHIGEKDSLAAQESVRGPALLHFLIPWVVFGLQKPDAV